MYLAAGSLASILMLLVLQFVLQLYQILVLDLDLVRPYRRCTQVNSDLLLPIRVDDTLKSTVLNLVLLNLEKQKCECYSR
jgi:hypothetical protein